MDKAKIYPSLQIGKYHHKRIIQDIQNLDHTSKTEYLVKNIKNNFFVIIIYICSNSVNIINYFYVYIYMLFNNLLIFD